MEEGSLTIGSNACGPERANAKGRFSLKGRRVDG